VTPSRDACIEVSGLPELHLQGCGRIGLAKTAYFDSHVASMWQWSIGTHDVTAA